MDLAICMILLVSGLLCPLLMLGFGLISRKHPPKTINCWYGYRTARSMKSQAAWDFAHRYCGRLWTWLGAILLQFPQRCWRRCSCLAGILPAAWLR